MSIAENIKRLRTQKELTQAELADKVGVNRSMIAQYERGSKQPTLSMAKELCIALDCTLDDIA